LPKNPVLAAFLSFLVPGMGQIYAGKILFGIGLIILSFIISTLTILLTIFGIILYVIIWLYAIYDAYATVKNNNGGD
jgi:TM2 domain-containing membrane protein YozV